jgi:hypothetical protein
VSFSKRLFLIGVRLVILALFLSEFIVGFYIFMVYRLVVCIVISFLKLRFKFDTQGEVEMSFLKSSVVSIIDAFLNLFTVVNFSDYKARFVPLICASYISIYCENITLFTIWITLTTYNHTWYYWPSIGVIIAFTVCYILCELLYRLCKSKQGEQDE